MSLHQGMTRRATGSDMGALRDQTAANIREWAGRRKQEPSEAQKRVLSVFGVYSVSGAGWSTLVA